MYRESRSECGRDQEKARTGVRPRLLLAPHRECEFVSSREARGRPAETSPPQPAQVRQPQALAIAAIGPRRTLTKIALQRCQCDHFLPPQLPTMDSTRTPGPGALPVCGAEDRATPR